MDGIEDSIRSELAKRLQKKTDDDNAAVNDVVMVYSQAKSYAVAMGFYEHLDLFNKINGDPVMARALEAAGDFLATWEKLGKGDTLPPITHMQGAIAYEETYLNLSKNALGGTPKSLDWVGGLGKTVTGSALYGYDRFPLPKIEYLDLSGHGLTIDDLEKMNLSQLKDLREVNFHGNRIKPGDMDRLNALLPASVEHVCVGGNDAKINPGFLKSVNGQNEGGASIQEIGDEITVATETAPRRSQAGPSTDNATARNRRYSLNPSEQMKELISVRGNAKETTLNKETGAVVRR